MTEAKLTWIDEDVDALKESGLYINLRVIDSPPGAWMNVDGKRVLNLCTNNYLGLANDDRLKEAARQAIDAYGVGPTAVRSIAGTLAVHVELEKAVAAFKGVEDALYVQAGFMANQAALPPLVGREDVIFSDRLNHASIIDGARLSRAKIVVYEVMSNGRVILLKVRGPEEDVMPTDETLESILDDAFVERLEALAQELVDGFYVPSFAHCASELGEG